MPRLDKFVIGVKPLQKMFRLTDCSGFIIDEIMTSRGKAIDENYFSEGWLSNDRSIIRLSNKSLGNSVTVDSTEGIVFTKDMYDSERKFDRDIALKEFEKIYELIDKTLHIKNIRRIGVVHEYQFKSKSENSSKSLIDSVTKTGDAYSADKFRLHIEERTAKSGAKIDVVDETKDDFFNLIIDIYDSTQDAEHPQKGWFNSNLDFQHYYAPVFAGNVSDEAKKMARLLEPKATSLLSNLRAWGLLNVSE